MGLERGVELRARDLGGQPHRRVSLPSAHDGREICSLAVVEVDAVPSALDRVDHGRIDGSSTPEELSCFLSTCEPERSLEEADDLRLHAPHIGRGERGEVDLKLLSQLCVWNALGFA